jgi:hypothetical protein
MTQTSKTNSVSPTQSAMRGQLPPNSSLVPNRRIPAWLMSLLLHTSILTALIVILGQFPNGASEIENRAGGIVLVNEKSTTTEYLSEGDVETESSPATAANSPPPQPAFAELPPDLPGLESSPTQITGAGDSLIESLPGGDSLIVGPKSSGKTGGQITTEIFGVKGTGSRFVYVIDRSDSMAGYAGRPMIAARQQLLASLKSLEESHQFQIIFYNQDVRIFNPDGRTTLHYATDPMKQEAEIFVNQTTPDGGTDHMNALLRAFKLGPDVIFLLTDAEGGFTEQELRDLVRYNRSAAIINTIEFGQRRGRDGSLQAVSRNSGGQYVFKNINTLRIDGN